MYILILINSFNYFEVVTILRKKSLFRYFHQSVFKDNYQEKKELGFIQWLAGLIDGDGYFILTKKGYTSCEITMDVRDNKALYEIKQKYGGSIKTISKEKALRYKLRHKKDLI